MQSRFHTGTVAAVLALLCSLTVHADDLENYRLTEKALDQYERATEAMYQFALEHPELAGALDEDDEEDDMDEFDPARTAREMDERAPGLRARMEKSGMKLEEYFTFGIALAANAFGAAMADQFGGADTAELTAAQRDNLDFVRRNQQRFEAFGARMQEKYGELMQDDEDYEEEAWNEEYSDDEYSDEAYSDE